MAENFFMSKNWLLNVAEKALLKARTPLFLRRLAAHARLKTEIGLALVISVVFGVMWSPLPSAASDTGGIELVVVPTGEVNLVTHEAVRAPVTGYRVTQKYWWLHGGLDMAASAGTEVTAIMSGKVKKAEKSWYGYGNLVVIEHTKEFESWYGHLSKILVKEGDEVVQGGVVGLVGSTGRSTGPHLHLEIRENGRPVNPAGMLRVEH